MYYGDADGFPLLHGNLINQGYLYTTVQDATTGGYGLEVVDITSSSSATKSSGYIAMEFTEMAIWGLNWLTDNGSLVGIAQDTKGNLVINGILGLPAVEGQQADTSWSTVATNTTKGYNQVWGNDGAVCAMGGIPGESDILYVLASQGPGEFTGVVLIGLCPVYGDQLSVARLNGEAYERFGPSCIYNMEAYDP